MIVTDGGFRPDGTFIHWPTHDPERLAEAFRCAVLRLLVRWELFEPDQAEAMLEWPHSGFHLRDRVWVAEEDRLFAFRLALTVA
jgi:hypothetical protein